jgi:V/A-type H+-transporting ATPase subunit A
MSKDRQGTLFWISGPVVRAHIDRQIAMAEQVWVGQDRLAAEVIDVSQTEATVQVYEETAGLHVGEPLYGTGRPLSVTLGPGLMGGVFDGIQRPLEVMHDQSGIFIARGQQIEALDTEHKWKFEPQVGHGDAVVAGSILGVVSETPLVEHRVLVPPGLAGTVVEVVDQGEYTILDQVATIEDADGEGHPLAMIQHWPVRVARPVANRQSPNVPLITGQRVIDIFFPVAKGGTAAIPGPFGAGKTVTLHSLAKWSDADIIIYVGCGERGNEMTDVLESFPRLEDPWTGHPLMERTILIANTSNMPVAARESSIYTGLTIAEYYRDQGYDVALMADSTSRWAQALREISGRLGEMPAEEGYPAYLASRLAAFYERAGRVSVLGRDDSGSVTIMGAVSPPGGDFSEPVTRHTQRFTRCFWALDRDLANQRHYPAISWEDSYSLYLDDVAGWWGQEVIDNWRDLRDRALHVLQQRSNLQRIVQLVGPEALSDQQRWILDVAGLLRDGFLDQDAYDPIDAYTVPEKQVKLLGAFLWLYDRGNELLSRGVPLARLHEELDMARLSRLRTQVPNDHPEQIDDVRQEIQEAFSDVLQTYSQ